MCMKMRRLNVIKVIPVNITHGAVIGKDKQGEAWQEQGDEDHHSHLC